MKRKDIKNTFDSFNFSPPVASRKLSGVVPHTPTHWRGGRGKGQNLSSVPRVAIGTCVLFFGPLNLFGHSSFPLTFLSSLLHFCQNML